MLQRWFTTHLLRTVPPRRLIILDRCPLHGAQIMKSDDLDNDCAKSEPKLVL
jgi:hypothetical protein